MIMLPKGNFMGRRIFVELKPGDNADLLGLELDRIISSVVQDKLDEIKKSERFKPGQARIIRTG
jgi:hypothetical protein